MRNAVPLAQHSIQLPELRFACFGLDRTTNAQMLWLVFAGYDEKRLQNTVGRWRFLSAELVHKLVTICFSTVLAFWASSLGQPSELAFSLGNSEVIRQPTIRTKLASSFLCDLFQVVRRNCARQNDRLVVHRDMDLSLIHI